MDEEARTYKKWYLPTYLPNNMLYVTSWWFIVNIRQGGLFSLVVMYEYEPYLSGVCKSMF